jgi:transcriptional antiterminator Rof (Rho-off)
MKHQEYRPIACALHEQYQLAALRGEPLQISWVDESQGSMQRVLRVLDVFTRDRAEYLTGVTLTGEEYRIRLDRISRAEWSDGGRALQGTGE